MLPKELQIFSEKSIKFIEFWLDEDKIVEKVSSRMIAIIGDYAPTAAAFKGDKCIETGNAKRQRFWLKVTLCSSQILYFRECSAQHRRSAPGVALGAVA